MATTPLLTHASPGLPLAYRGGRAISAGQFVLDACFLAERLPEGTHVLNVCGDRYRFAVGFAAALLTRKVSLLPSTHTPEVIRQLLKLAPDAFCITDDAACMIDLPQLPFPRDLPGCDDPQVRGGASRAEAAHAAWRVPRFDAEQLAALVFTSGSTGMPVPHPKTWGRLSLCVSNGAARLGLTDGRRHALVGTVPVQHMYGFESTLLVGLQSGNSFCAERPFYPADIAATLAAVPAPRTLVSTPIHLRALLASDTQFPAIDAVLSATAPLTQSLAQDVEARLHAPLIEIYGSTETGQIATRKTGTELAWRLWPDVELVREHGQTVARGGHVERPTPLGDAVEMLDDGRFLLHGRNADMVNIAGKRSSFAYLDHQLTAITGVKDGAFFMSETAGNGAAPFGAAPVGAALVGKVPDAAAVNSAAQARATGSLSSTRVAALVVAPGLTATQIQAELRLRIDPVFLPRPLLLVESLPRNATGKLPRDALQALAAAHLKKLHER